MTGEDEEEKEEENLDSSNSSDSNATVKVEKSSSNNSSSVKNNKKSNGSSKSSSSNSSGSNGGSSSSGGSSVSNPKITTKTTTTTETIAYNTKEEADDTLEKGKRKVHRKGKNGVVTITYKETYTDGKLTSKEETSRKTTTKPVTEIIKVGIKENKPKTISASEAHRILQSAGLDRSVDGNSYYYRLGSYEPPISVHVGSNGVEWVHYSNMVYQSFSGMTKAELIEMFGEEEGTIEYEYGEGILRDVENAARAAANAVYGSGTSQANQFYNEMMNSSGLYREFR